MSIFFLSRKDDVYIVAQQATEVYYLSYLCKTNQRLKGWDIVYKVSPHDKVPVPNNKDYNIDPNTYDEEFFQEDGLQGHFVIELIESIRMEVDHDEWVDDEDAGDEVHNAKNVELLERVQLGVDDDIPPLDHGPEYLDMHDSDDETYDPANPNQDDYL